MSHQPKDVTVRAQAADAAWEIIGTDRRRGIWPENVSLEADAWGSSRASFDLRRDPRASWPDLGAFTPIEIEVAGVLVWSGRIVETPTRDGADRALNVQCEGWQYHLDDDLYELPYVHTRIADWRDARSFPNADLTHFVAAPQVVSDRGLAMLAFPANVTTVNTTAAAIILDLGQSVGNRIVAIYDTQTTRGNITAEILAGNDVSSLVSQIGDNFSTSDTDKVLAVTTGGSFRYACFSLGSAAGGDFTDATDIFLRVKALLVFADPAYESGNASVLQAPTVINDALDRGTFLLSEDRSQIDPDATVTLDIPELALGEPKTPREMIQGVNAYHNYVTQVDVLRRMVFKPQPAAALIEVGAWSMMDFADASANNAQEIYNRTIVQGQAPGGQPLRVSRYTADDDTTGETVVSSPAPTNPSFATNTTGWSVVSVYTSTITRVTAGSIDSSPASGEWHFPGFIYAGDSLTGTFTGTFLAGVTYRLTFRWLSTATDLPGYDVRWGDLAAGDFGFTHFNGVTSWTSFVVTWTPTADRTSVSVEFSKPSEPLNSEATSRVDTLTVSIAKPTVVDRRGFRRTRALPVSSALPADGAIARQIADLWLARHKVTPFKGTAQLVGDACRDALTGSTVPVEQLLLRTQELLRFSDRIDPDTGDHGRDGRIASVKYDPEADQATVTIDNTRADFDALLARLAVVTGSGN